MISRSRSSAGADEAAAARMDDAMFSIEAVLPHRLRPPRRRNVVFERPALLALVEEGLAGQVVCVHAPAGFGKTELLVAAHDHLRRPGERFCWMTMDALDADLGVFLKDVAATVRSAGMPPRRVGWKGVARPIGADPEEGFAAVWEALLGKQGGPVTLFVDDVDAAPGVALRAGLGALIRRFPEDVRIVTASRGRPDLPISVLRTRDLLAEIGADELAFTIPETVQLFADALSSDDAGRLHAVTGGWPAPLALARRSLGSTTGSAERALLLSGSHSLLRAYVDEEVLSHVPEDVTDALEICAVLDAFPLELVAHLSGPSLDATMLVKLERLSPLVEVISETGRWVRLQPLIRLALQSRANVRPPEATAPLHVRAAIWFAEHGIFDLAVTHAAHGGDFALAVDAIRRAGGVNIFLRAGYATLSRLLADLPASVVQHSSVLRLAHALVLGKQGQIHLAREIIDDLKAVGPGPDTIPAADLEHIDGMIDLYEDRNLEGEQVARLRLAAQDLATYDNWERAWIYNHLCIAYQRSGDLRAARHAGLRALTYYRGARTPYGQVFMMVHVGTVLMATGRLSAALKLLHDADALLRDTHASETNVAALIHVPMAACLYHRGDLDKATSLLAAALPIVKQGEGWVDAFARGFATMARAKFLHEGLDAALAVLDEAEVLAVERVLPRLETSIALLRADLLTRAGLLDAASHILNGLPTIATDQSVEEGWQTLRERHEAHLATARLLVRRGRLEEGLAYAKRLLASAEAADMGLDVLAARAVAIEALWCMQRHDDALRHLLALLAVAMPQQATQVVRDGDARLAAVLRAIVRRFGLSTFRPEGVAYLAAILGPLRPRRLGDAVDSASVVLTEREAEVLAGLDRGSANKEIARDLRLTEAAVKFHLKNLFRKLGVSRRTLALSVARQMGLLPEQASAANVSAPAGLHR